MRHALLSLLGMGASALAGQFAPAPDDDHPNNGTTAVAADSPAIQGWATGVVQLTRGLQDERNPDGNYASYGAPGNALGAADADPNDTYPVVSLGEGGSITLSFNLPIANGPGFDFAVFENSPSDTQYLELAYVEVSSDGLHFTGFHTTSLTKTKEQVSGDTSGPLGSIDPTDLNNLAGKYRAGYGTPFDLGELTATPLLDLSAIRYVRITDIVGDIGASQPALDSSGNIINDSWPTLGSTSGFDLDAVAVLNTVPEPGSLLLLLSGGLAWSRRRR